MGFLAFSAIPSSAVLRAMTVSLNITHPKAEDIDVYLVDPLGSEHVLSTDNGGTTADYRAVTFFNGFTSRPIAGAAGPLVGVYQPEVPIPNFTGNVLAQGGWFLKVVDDSPGSTGRLTAWKIDIDYAYSGSVVGSSGGDRGLFALFGSDGVDRMLGNAGSDELFGRDGNDFLDGGKGNDSLSGESGNDLIRGGSGRDYMYGGDGRDVFDFDKVRDIGKTSSTRDAIDDFEHGRDDIDLRTIDADTETRGNQAFRFIGKDAFSHEAGEVRYKVSGNHTIVMGDVDGDGRYDFQIDLVGVINLTKGDFLL
ncbi:MAG: proprotein convertase P-domain-containing protein [Hyphomicrobiaceae bacterium]